MENIKLAKIKATKPHKQQIQLSFVLVALFLVALAFASPWFDTSVSNHSFIKSYFGGIGIGILFLITLWNNRNQNSYLSFSHIKISFGTLFVLGTLSIFWSVNPDFTITKWLIWLNIFMAFMVSYNFIINQQNIVKFCWAVLIAGFIIAIIGVLQYLFDPFQLTQAIAPSSTFGNKNMSTQPLILILPLSLFLLTSSLIKGRQIWIVALAISIMLTFVFYTTTRGAWLSIFGEIILISGFLIIKRKSLQDFMAWNRERTQASIVAIVLSLIMINFSADGFTPFWKIFFQITSEIYGTVVNGGEIRTAIWGVTIGMIKHSPFFGTGLGSWFHNEIQGGYGIYDVYSYQRAHNDILEMAVEVGIVGVALFFAGIIFVIIAIFKIINNDVKDIAWFYFIVLVALSGSFLNMQFSFPYQLAFPATMFGLYVGMIAKRSELFVQPLKTLQLNKIYKKINNGFWVVVFIIISSIYIQWIVAYSTLNKINLNGKFDQLNKMQTPIYHLEMQNILGFLANAYFNQQKYKISMQVDEQILKYWPNYEVALYRYSYALLQQKLPNEALKFLQRGKASSVKGMYNSYILELEVYRDKADVKNFNKSFIEFMKQPEKLLAMDIASYKYLVLFSNYSSKVRSYTIDLYYKYNKYHPYNCQIENALMLHYFNEKQYNNALNIITTATNNKQKICFDKNAVKLINVNILEKK